MQSEIRNKILDIVHSRPRAIAEIAQEIKKNWRTANRYVEQLVAEDILKIHVFRKGSHGALKIAYWPSSLSENPSGVKNYLLQKILSGVKKEDFSALDIIQHIPNKKRKVNYLKKELYNSKDNLENFTGFLKKAKNKILFLSGNLSYMHLSDGYGILSKILEEKLQQGVDIFILTRVDKSDSKIIKALADLNKKDYRGNIEIRYAYQPLRCTIIDQKEARLKEDFLGYSNIPQKENEGTYIYATNDANWVEWLSNVFWHIWRISIPAQKRLSVIEEIN